MIVRSTTFVASMMLLFAVASGLLQFNTQQQQQTLQQPTVVNNSSPFWRRTGCYVIGHMRTISIPGCVKFNLSTNACRGYCMSYSIPNTMDLGPSSADVELEPVVSDINLAYVARAPSSKGGQASEGSIKGTTESLLIVPDSSLTLPSRISQEASSEKSFGGMATIDMRVRKSHMEGQSTVASHGGTSSISGADKREVVSVSQCCNMMETNEVVVNVRCGVNEIRRLTFKSAKSCECFFCKHV